MSRERNVRGTKCPETISPGEEMSWERNVRGTKCPETISPGDEMSGGEVSKRRIVRYPSIIPNLH